MPLTLRYIPGIVLTVGQVVDEGILNKLANPTFELEGTIGSQTIGPGVVTLDKLGAALAANFNSDGSLVKIAYPSLDSSLQVNFNTDGSLLVQYANLSPALQGNFNADGSPKVWASALTAVAGGSHAYAFTHTLGRVPALVRKLVLVCQTAEAGYAIGDEVEPVANYASVTTVTDFNTLVWAPPVYGSWPTWPPVSTTTHYGIAVSVTSTSATVVQAGAVRILSKSSLTMVGITESRWKLKLYLA